MEILTRGTAPKTGGITESPPGIAKLKVGMAETPVFPPHECLFSIDLGEWGDETAGFARIPRIPTRVASFWQNTGHVPDKLENIACLLKIN
jgi:hypothetical protein